MFAKTWKVTTCEKSKHCSNLLVLLLLCAPVYGLNVFIYVKENTRTRHRATIHRRLRCNVIRYSSILYHFWIISLTLPIPAESAHTGMINSSVSFMCLAGYRCRVGVDDCVWYQAPFVWETNLLMCFFFVFLRPSSLIPQMCFSRISANMKHYFKTSLQTSNSTLKLALGKVSHSWGKVS